MRDRTYSFFSVYKSIVDTLHLHLKSYTKKPLLHNLDQGLHQKKYLDLDWS